MSIQCTCPGMGWTNTSCGLHPHQPFGSVLAEIESTEEGRTGMAVARAELALQAKILAAVEGLERFLEYETRHDGGITSAAEGERFSESAENNLGVGFALYRDEEYLKLSEVLSAIREVTG